jgi:DNA polymerase III subunit delta'
VSDPLPAADPDESGERAADDEPPVVELFAAVVGQPRAVAQLRAAARRPVHSYLLHGPRGTGKRAAARAFAASLLCPRGGCGHCNVCRRALAGTHPDLVTVERTGAMLDVDEARRITARAQRHPVESSRQVLMVSDVHLAATGRSAPALLKTVEEPPPSTVFVLLADDLPATLATIASRSALVRFDSVPTSAIAAWLVESGVDPVLAESVAAASEGRLDRARLLVDDPGLAARQEQWRTVPKRLDGTGATAASVATELLDGIEDALAPLRARHELEMTELAEQAEAIGARGVPGRRQIEERQRREARRLRTDELRHGLAVLSGVYRDRLVGLASSDGGARTPGAAAAGRRAARGVQAIREASDALTRNANEGLVMDALMVELSGMTD